MSHLAHRPSDPAYYIEDCRISTLCALVNMKSDRKSGPDVKWIKLITVQYSAAHPHTVAALIQDQPSVMAGIVKVALTMRHCVP